MEVSGQLHAPAALPPGKKPPVPTEQEAGWPQGRAGRCGKIHGRGGNRTPVVQPVLCHRTESLLSLIFTVLKKYFT
jgi:hypothetical protein